MNCSVTVRSVALCSKPVLKNCGAWVIRALKFCCGGAAVVVEVVVVVVVDVRKSLLGLRL